MASIEHDDAMICLTLGNGTGVCVAMVENDFPISYSISSQGGQSALALELRPRGAHSGLPAPHTNTVRSISQ